jgi:hypothetical protein
MPGLPPLIALGTPSFLKSKNTKAKEAAKNPLKKQPLLDLSPAQEVNNPLNKK